MFKPNVDKVLKVLTILPPLLVILLSLIITSYVVLENQNNFEKESLKLKKEFLDNNRNNIKSDVLNVYKFIKSNYRNTEEKLKVDLKNRVNDAHNIVLGILNNNKDLSKEMKIKLIKDSLRDVRFNDGRGYYYIYSMQGECILLPIQKRLEGKSFLEVKDVRGKYITKSIIESLKSNEDNFMSWWWFKPSDTKKQYQKLSYNKYIKELDMYIGTGEYVLDYENEIKKDVLYYLTNLPYDVASYIFILDYKGKFIFHPNSEIINKYAKSFSNMDKYNIEEIIEIAKIGDGFISYDSTFFGEYSMATMKTSYIRGLDRWNWAIGSGFFKDKINESLLAKQKVLEKYNREFVIKIVTLSVLITCILVLVLIYNIEFLKNRFETIQRKINKEVEMNIEKDKLLFHQSKMASLGEMLQNIAHQWRQPLSIISTAASGMKVKKDFDSLDSKDIDDTVSTIMKSTNYLSKTIDDFRDFFRTDKKSEIFNLCDAIQDSIDILDIKLLKNNIKIVFEKKEFIYDSFRNEFIQVVMNILSNAIDAFIEGIDKYIFIDINIVSNNLEISIKDSAGGINENIIDRIFEPYFTTKHKSQGTGIGLYMSEEIITKHFEGKIFVDNVEYKYEDKKLNGSNFVILLPIKKGQL
ncbi:cache domain-containing protein [Poseidonibacter lekithochrous]|uniref:sensor histidine kinase n=1 Tax=Poseidonibacter lekithochrous TaxID=1904463 RepID=UPI0008FC433D|nr:cache domain-containing protein [Poseidonibacter lekithochrous]QKJ24571.1 Cache sensor-containing signal transduction histidine kinase [Poseidonibacter lekithochrous]